MILQDDDQFNDAGLKNALRRSFGHERAPEALRLNVQQLFVGTAVPVIEMKPTKSATLRDAWERWNSVVYSGIAACVMIAGAAFLVMSYQGYFDRNPRYTRNEPVIGDVPSNLAVALINRHNACSQLKDHHILKGDNLPALKVELERQMNFPVAIVALGDGWVFKGAGRCDVGNTPSAHVLFARGKQELSVFSMPADIVRNVSTHTGPTLFESQYRDDPIAGGTRGAVTYAVVGSSTDGSLTLGEVVTLRDQVMASIPALPGEDCARVSRTAPIAAIIP
jgi:hypothetical protein